VECEPLDALTRHYGTRRRADSTEADLVLAWIRRGDDAFAWSLPVVRQHLRIPVLAFERRPYALDDAGREALRSALPAA
jgi:hypothetical protein